MNPRAFRSFVSGLLILRVFQQGLCEKRLAFDQPDRDASLEDDQSIKEIAGQARAKLERVANSLV